MSKNSKLKFFNKFLVFLLIFSWVFLPLSNFVGPYLPKPAQKLVKLTQTRTAQALTAGPNNPGTETATAGGAGACSDNSNWSVTAGDLNADDIVQATYTGGNWDDTEITDPIDATNFGFSINASSIDGVTVSVLAWAPEGGTWHTVQLIDSVPAVVGDNKAVDVGVLETSEGAYDSFGGVSDNWNASLDETDVNSANFGVRLCITANANNATRFIDHVTITIEYTAPASADLSWDTGAADFEIWAGATATTDAVLTWDNGTLICSASLNDDNGSLSVCGSLNKNQKYRVQAVLDNDGGTAASMASGDFVDQVNVKTFWAGTNPTISAETDCGFADGATFGESDDDTATTCNVAFNGNDVRITNTGTAVLLAATTGTEGFMYLLTTSNVSFSDSSTYMNASIDSITEDSSRVTIGLKMIPGVHIRGRIVIRGRVNIR